MINITIVSVGRLKEPYLRDAAAEYIKRLGAFCRLSVIEVDEYRTPERPSEAQIQTTLQTEGKRILDKIPAGAALISLCIEGKMMSSPDFSLALDKLAVSGCSHVVFAIGGSWGLSQEVKNASLMQLSMSRMTFPHQLARIMFMEQIYRAMQISSGGKYHK